MKARVSEETTCGPTTVDKMTSGWPMRNNWGLLGVGGRGREHRFPGAPRLRSVRAELLHTAPTLGVGVKALFRIRM